MSAEGGYVARPGPIEVTQAEIDDLREYARRHWSKRGVYALLERAEPALRNELLIAWAERDSALAEVQRCKEAWAEVEDSLDLIQVENAALRAALVGPDQAPNEPGRCDCGLPMPCADCT